MNKTYLLLLAVIAFTACSENNSTSDNHISENSNSDKDSVSTEIVKEPKEYFLSKVNWDSIASTEKLCYVLNYAGTSTEEEAIQKVDSLLPNFPNAGYLWIPDFSSLSGKEMFAVFLDKSPYRYSIMENMQNWKQDNPGIYLVKVDQSNERWVAYSPIDIRINGEKLKMILTYAEPEEVESYYEEGGEDWGWFVNDVGEFFADNHPEVMMESVFNSGLLDSEIQSIENELGDELEGFCYIFVDGKKKMVVGHDFSQSVISQACDFFGYELPDFGY